MNQTTDRRNQSGTVYHLQACCAVFCGRSVYGEVLLCAVKWQIGLEGSDSQTFLKQRMTGCSRRQFPRREDTVKPTTTNI